MIRAATTCFVLVASLAFLSTLHADFVYKADDGTAETNAQSNDGKLGWYNYYIEENGQDVIVAIEAAFGSPSSVLIGETVEWAVFDDINDDKDFSTVAVLAQGTHQIQNAFFIGNGVLDVIPVPGVEVSGGFFIGIWYDDQTGQNTFPAPIDLTNFQDSSYFTTGNTGVTDLTDITFNSPSFISNWILRARAVPEPNCCALVLLAVSGLTLVRRRRCV